MTRIKKAMKLFNENSCAQTVALTFEDIVDLNKDQIKRALAAYGGGLCCHEACGALTAGLFIIGLLSRNMNEEFFSKTVDKFTQNFSEETGYKRCEDLLADLPGNEEKANKKRREICENAITFSVNFIEKLI